GEYGRGRAMHAYDLTRHVLDRWNAAPQGASVPGAMPGFASRVLPLGVATAPEALRTAYVADPLCAAALDDDAGLTRARGHLVWLTAQSVARRQLADRAKNTTSPYAEARISGAGQAPWSPDVSQARLDEVTREVLDRLAVRGTARVPGGAGRC